MSGTNPPACAGTIQTRPHDERVSRGRGRSGRFAGPIPGVYPIDSGTAELIRDRDNPDGYLLMINHVESSHIDLSDPTNLEFEYIRWIASIIQEHQPPTTPMRVLHLGAAACSLARYLIDVRPGSQHLAVDTDAELARLVREWFDLPKAPALRIRIGDARAVTEALPDAGFSVVVRDVFAGAVTPAPLITVEFARQAQRVLRPGGLYVVNCADTLDLRLVRSEIATFARGFRPAGRGGRPADAQGPATRECDHRRIRHADRQCDIGPSTAGRRRTRPVMGCRASPRVRQKRRTARRSRHLRPKQLASREIADAARVPAHTVRPDSATDRSEMGRSVCARRFCMRRADSVCAGRDCMRGGEAGGQRMKAAATPESTGIRRPVVMGRVPLVSASTASAMCSGSTSSLRTVRCA